MRRYSVLAALAVSLFGCGFNFSEYNEPDGSTSSTSHDDDPSGTSSETGTSDTAEPTTTGGNGECVMTECHGEVYECGDCVDNDGDGARDSSDRNCWGPCDNSERQLESNNPGENQAPCSHLDCYFDGNSSSADDGCHWSHTCDPTQPNPSACSHDPSADIPGSSLDCQSGQLSQDPACRNKCRPLVPNGCDCFGCCEIQVGGGSYTVFLGTGEAPGTCTIEDAADPQACAACVQVEPCLNHCDRDACEICIGELAPPDGCDAAGCPNGIEACNPLNNSSDCPAGTACVTGCCHPFPQ